MSDGNDVWLASADTIDGAYSLEGSALAGVSGYAPCLVLDDGTWYLYTSKDGDIALYTSDTVNSGYTEHANSPLLTPEHRAGAVDYSRASEPYVFYDSDAGLWRMLYMGGDVRPAATATEYERICMATASDPAGPWTKSNRSPLWSGVAGRYDGGYGEHRGGNEHNYPRVLRGRIAETRH